MPITFACECGARLKAPDRAGGRRISCPKCQSSVTVPTSDDTIALAPLESETKLAPRRELLGEIPSKSVARRGTQNVAATSSTRQLLWLSLGAVASILILGMVIWYVGADLTGDHRLAVDNPPAGTSSGTKRPLAFYDGTWKGTTFQNKPFAFTVRDSVITSASIETVNPGGLTGLCLDLTRGEHFAIVNDTFHLHFASIDAPFDPDSAKASFAIRGQLTKEHAAEGRVEIIYPHRDPEIGDWRARRISMNTTTLPEQEKDATPVATSNTTQTPKEMPPVSPPKEDSPTAKRDPQRRRPRFPSGASSPEPQREPAIPGEPTPFDGEWTGELTQTSGQRPPVDARFELVFEVSGGTIVSMRMTPEPMFIPPHERISGGAVALKRHGNDKGSFSLSLEPDLAPSGVPVPSLKFTGRLSSDGLASGDCNMVAPAFPRGGPRGMPPEFRPPDMHPEFGPSEMHPEFGLPEEMLPSFTWTATQSGAKESEAEGEIGKDQQKDVVPSPSSPDPTRPAKDLATRGSRAEDSANSARSGNNPEPADNNTPQSTARETHDGTWRATLHRDGQLAFTVKNGIVTEVLIDADFGDWSTRIVAQPDAQGNDVDTSDNSISLQLQAKSLLSRGLGATERTVPNDIKATFGEDSCKGTHSADIDGVIAVFSEWRAVRVSRATDPLELPNTVAANPDDDASRFPASDPARVANPEDVEKIKKKLLRRGAGKEDWFVILLRKKGPNGSVYSVEYVLAHGADKAARKLVEFNPDGRSSDFTYKSYPNTKKGEERARRDAEIQMEEGRRAVEAMKTQQPRIID